MLVLIYVPANFVFIFISCKRFSSAGSRKLLFCFEDHSFFTLLLFYPQLAGLFFSFTFPCLKDRDLVASTSGKGLNV